MTALYRLMRRVAPSAVPVIVRGETGAGKEPVALTLHASSGRRGAFVSLSCAAIPSELLEAELFGIEQGVATGVTARAGRFRQAEGGTLFLDEIGEMSPHLQAKLLRALQEKEIHPVGGEPRSIDVRIVSATNADLDARMQRGDFRPDLYFRLAGCTLEVPALREISEDIPGLVAHFLGRFVADTGTRVHGLTVRALQRLMAYRWPGNVRELEHEMRRLVHMAEDGEVIDVASLAAPIRAAAGPSSNERPEPGGLDLAARVRLLETDLIREALRRTDGKPTHAARLLGLSRNGLAKKMRRLGIER